MEWRERGLMEGRAGVRGEGIEVNVGNGGHG